MDMLGDRQITAYSQPTQRVIEWNKVYQARLYGILRSWKL